MTRIEELEREIELTKELIRLERELDNYKGKGGGYAWPVYPHPFYPIYPPVTYYKLGGAVGTGGCGGGGK